MSVEMKELAVRLFDVGVVKFGDFLTKSGIRSPVYFDLRVIVSHPAVLEAVSRAVVTALGDDDLICGVPYTALPIAAVASVQSGVPMVMRRKEVKRHGTGKTVEGAFEAGQSCAIVEDVVTSGSSVRETRDDLVEAGLIVRRAIVVLDRQQGARENLARNDIALKSLFTVAEFLDALLGAGRIDAETVRSVTDYLTSTAAPINTAPNKSHIPFLLRSEATLNPIAKNLFRLMHRKKTNLCIAADLTSSREVLKLLESVAPYVCMFKLHADIIQDFNDDFTKQLIRLAEQHEVVIMEDRKFSDIGNTVALQCTAGAFKINSWADVVTVHSLPGPGVLKAIKNSFSDRLKGVFVVVEMSSENNLASDKYIEDTMKMIESELETVAGVVCQNGNIVKHQGLIQLTPGVKLNRSTDNLGQNYNTPSDIVSKNGADIAVVGRGIIEASDPADEACKYRDVLWSCYEERLK